MDANKKAELLKLGYRIPGACGLCSHGNFPTATSQWGTCKINLYTHQKHTGEQRELSINRFGRCNKFLPSVVQYQQLEGFAEFASL